MTAEATRPTRTSACAGPGVGAGPGPRTVRASLAQERVWLASRIADDSPLYHVLDRFRLFARVEPGELAEAFTRIARRHEPLRTALRVVDGTLTQVVEPVPGEPPRVVDLRALSEASDEDRARRIDEIARQEAAIPFDLAEAPLWRAVLVRLGEAEWLVLLVAHLAVFDAASAFNLHAELTEICAALEQGRDAELPDLPTSYSEFALEQRRRLADDGAGGLAEYWHTALAGIPAVHGLPTDRPRPAVRSFAGAELTTAIPAGTAQALPELARRLTATPFLVLLAAYAALIHRRSGRDDVVIGVPVAGRDRAELLPLIGVFVNMVVLRIPVSGASAFGELVDRVRAVATAAWEHQEMPLQHLVRTLAGARAAGVPPLYQLGFNQLTEPAPGPGATAAEDDLLFEVCDDTLRVEYNTALFDADTVRSLAADYLRLLTAGVADPALRVDALPVEAPPAEASAIDALRGSEDPPTAAVNGAAPRRAPVTGEHVAPRTAVEHLVAAAWAEVLGVEGVGVHDDFFALGGYSLPALRVIARLSTTCGVELRIPQFFADPTVAGVAAALEDLLSASATNEGSSR